MKDKGSENFSGSLAIFLVFVVGSILFFVLHRMIYSLQIFLYQRPGEALIGSSRIVIGIFALVLSLDFFIVDSFYKLVGKRYPEFCRTYYHDSKGKVQINEDAFGKFKIALGGILILGICGVCFFFNEYISLSDQYIAASTMSFVNNRKEYNYSEIQIIKSPSRKSNGRWVYKYVFPDGRELSNIGAFERNTIQLIQNAQKKADVNRSSVYEKTGTSSGSKPLFVQILSYLIWASIFFFIPWTLNKLFKKKDQ